MTETTKKTATAQKRKPRPRPANAIAITVWPQNGTPIPQAAIEKFEEAVRRVQFELFNEGLALLTQTTRA